MPIPQFKIGDIVFHRMGEKGRIVRILDKQLYVVKIELSPPFEGSKEALWNARDISHQRSHPEQPG